MGDIVVVHPPAGAESDVSEMCGGGAPPVGQMCAEPTPERADAKFVKHGASDDSRFWGPVPEDWLVGWLWFVYNNPS